MMYFSRLKSATILAVCLLGVLLCLPNLIAAPAAWMPWRQVRLGLDLRGGSYLLLQVDAAAVLKERLDSIADGARTALRGKVQGFQPPAAQPSQERVDIRMPAGPQQDQAVQLLRDASASAGEPSDYNVAADGNEILLTLPPNAMRDRLSGAVTQSIEIVRRRIDESGTIDPQIARQGDDRIAVQLPGIEDPARVKALLGKTAKMTFRLLDDSANTAGAPPPASSSCPARATPPRSSRCAAGSRWTAPTSPTRSRRPTRNAPAAGWSISPSTASAPAASPTSPAPTSASLSPSCSTTRSSPPPASTRPSSAAAARSAAASTRSPPRTCPPCSAPAPCRRHSRSSRSAASAPNSAPTASAPAPSRWAVGFLLVIAYMALFYGLFGWFANIALLFNLVLQIAILSLLEATLTLPGMAGILLTLGVAVDANILINERIREEVRHGRTPLNALETGYRRAFGTIIDSNATAFLAHVMLFIFGSGPVRGFAVTITVGIVTTLFTATVVARLLTVRWYIGNKPQLLPV